MSTDLHAQAGGALQQALGYTPDDLVDCAALFVSARLRWPAIQVELGAFCEHVIQRLMKVSDGGGEQLAAKLGALHLSDLYLAHAAALSDPEAVGVVAKQLNDVAPCLARAGTSGVVASELLQTLAIEILLPRPRAGPAIRGYSGKASLRWWLRSVAVRAARRGPLQGARAQVEQAESMEDERLLEGVADPEVAYLKHTAAEVVNEQFDRALASLSVDERLLLRQHYLDGLSVDHLGAARGIHRSTAARRLTRVRSVLLDRLRSGLRERLDATGSEVDSLMRLVRSRLEIELASRS